MSCTKDVAHKVSILLMYFLNDLDTHTFLLIEPFAGKQTKMELLMSGARNIG